MNHTPHPPGHRPPLGESPDLDLRQVRAFVVTEEESHVGRAAAELVVSQQALSKRIRRLEEALGEQLFIRRARGVELTEAGRRFLPHARALLTAAAAAAAAARPGARPLRIDVWGSRLGPHRMLASLFPRVPDLDLELTMRRGLGNALGALLRHEIDVAFGRIHEHGRRWPDDLTHHLAVLEPIAVVVRAEHPLATATVVHPTDLSRWGVWWPAGDGPLETLGYIQHFTEAFGVAVDTRRYAADLVSPIELLRNAPDRVLAWGRDWLVPPNAGTRTVTLDPTPLYPWSMVSRDADPHPLLARLDELVIDAGRDEGWLTVDPDRHWLPDIDLACLPGATAALTRRNSPPL